MIITNAKVFSTENGFVEKDVHIEGEYFTDSKQPAAKCTRTMPSAADTEVIDAAGAYLIPGLVDIHFHGCAGYDFCDGTIEAMTKIAAYELSCGITSICPATMTLSEQVLNEIVDTAASFALNSSTRGDTGADLCGINLEGPFISHKKKGAQNDAYIMPPNVAMYRRLQAAAGGLVRLITIAPEMNGSMDFIRELHDEVRISLGHTDCDYETASAAFEAGACHVTHLFNAMPGLTHRAPGPIGAAFDSPDTMVELICDGNHIHPSAIRSAFALFGGSRIVLISDSMMATGMEDGSYALGGQPVNVHGSLATLADGTLAGSVTNLMDCMKKAVSMGIPLDTAVRCATINPATAIHMDHVIGSIDSGKLANCLLLDADTLALQTIIYHGHRL